MLRPVGRAYHDLRRHGTCNTRVRLRRRALGVESMLSASGREKSPPCVVEPNGGAPVIQNVNPDQIHVNQFHCSTWYGLTFSEVS